MASLQVDVAEANRFISHLSKSLQTLCHGCMDFDSGIEIVGYININIDSGSKVDYVLNEKVLKSTTNSMTFVSNSFLAKKDVPKQTQDGACSPIPELRPQPQTPYYRGAYQGPRSSIHFSHSQNYRGSQKRTWPGMERDWRMSPKKYRGGRMGHHPGFQGGSMSQNTAQTQSHLSGTQTADSETEFKVPVPSDGNQLPDAQSAVNVKKEVMDSDNAQDSLQLDQNTTEQSLPTSQINIKKDPDAEGSQNLNEAQTDPAYESASTSAVDGDFKGTFLQPENDPSYTENIGEAGTSQNAELNSTVDPSNQNSSLLSEHSDTSNIPGEYGATSDSYADAVPSCSGEFGETAGDESFSQSAYSDAGEGSNDGGQFEVIEIEDEDEDVQGLFGDTQRRRPMTNAEKCKAYRRRRAQDETRHAIAKQKNSEACKRFRASQTPAQKERSREGSRIRQQRFMQRKKNQMESLNMPASDSTSKRKARSTPRKAGHQAHNADREREESNQAHDDCKGEGNRMHQQGRNNMAPEKKKLELDKRKENYRERKAQNKFEISIE